jgi:hypothetical protein
MICVTRAKRTAFQGICARDALIASRARSPRGLIYHRAVMAFTAFPRLRLRIAASAVSVLLIALAACYDPRPQPGAPCSVDPVCPSGQVCVAGICVAEGAAQDAQVDGPPVLADRDQDGISDQADNCVELTNADQGNEDGDARGDVCDPCPIEANDAPSDPDGDGVADGCDPRPNAPGDKIVVFEGFHRGIPATWQVVGNATAANDDIVLTSIAGNHAAVVPAPMSVANGTLTASLHVEATVGNEDSAIAVVMPYDPNSNDGIFCELYAPNAGSANGRYISLYDSPQDVERGTRNLAWATATPYRVALTRGGTNGSNYTCSVTPDAGAPQVASGSTTARPAASRAALAVYGANARAAWMMLVSSP